MAVAPTPSPELAVLDRLVRPERDDLPAAAARALLKLELDPRDVERLHVLAVKAQDGVLTSAEEADLEGYRRVGRFLDLLRAKARRSLKSRGLRP